MKSIVNLTQQIERIIEQSSGNISVVVEINQQFIINKDGEQKKSSASLIKIPIMMAAYHKVESGEISLSDRINVKNNQKVEGSGVIQYLDEKTSLTIKDLLTLMIIVSDNTATNLLIELVGLESIHRFNQLLGCHHTRVERKLMDYVAREKGYDNVTSASDMIKFLREIENNQYLTSISNQEILSILAGQQFQHKLPAMMDLDHVFVANKTGEIPGVEHDVGIIHYGANKAYIAVLIDQLENSYSGKDSIARIGKVVSDYLV
ncbi:serine hydrolase [Heyndrickxia sporothermodurans]|nr:serine hydrolase [Heyndrickxia sporothermodurans]